MGGPPDKGISNSPVFVAVLPMLLSEGGRGIGGTLLIYEGSFVKAIFTVKKSLSRLQGRLWGPFSEIVF